MTVILIFMSEEENKFIKGKNTVVDSVDLTHIALIALLLQLRILILF